MTSSVPGLGPAPLHGMWRVCEAVLAAGGPALQQTVDAVRLSLTEPLRVAVAGRIKAGKSTLVNSLVGRLVAPTAAGECTRVVTWYRYGSPDRAEIIRRDGIRVPLPFNGALPEELGMPVEEIDRVQVFLQAGALRQLTLIDTPGLATTTRVNEEATRRALLGDTAASNRAVGQADAVLFLFREAERSDEIDFLRDLQASFGDLGTSAVNTIGLLSHADLFGAGPFSADDPIAIATERAREIARDRVAELGTVVPVSALLAETARTGRLRESDARHLATLAEVDATALRLADRLGPPPGVDADDLDTLFRLLGPYGVARGRTVAAQGAEAVLDWLHATSGVAEVESLIHTRFVRRSQALKADHALATLEQAALGLPTERQVLAILEQARMDEDLHPIRELRALGLLSRLDPVNPLRDSLLRLIDARTDAERLGMPDGTGGGELAEAARKKGAAAQAEAGFAITPAAAEAARVLARSYLLLARRQLARQQGLGRAPAAEHPTGPTGVAPGWGGPVPHGPVQNGPVPSGLVPQGPVPNGPVPHGPVPGGSFTNAPVPPGFVPSGPVRQPGVMSPAAVPVEPIAPPAGYPQPPAGHHPPPGFPPQFVPPAGSYPQPSGPQPGFPPPGSYPQPSGPHPGFAPPGGHPQPSDPQPGSPHGSHPQPSGSQPGLLPPGSDPLPSGPQPGFLPPAGYPQAPAVPDRHGPLGAGAHPDGQVPPDRPQPPAEAGPTPPRG